MEQSHPRGSFSCTLDAPAFRVREEEFRSLFARSLRSVDDATRLSARLLLDSVGEPELRDLLAREQRCCSFFDFAVEETGDCLALTVHVPAGSEAALTFLLALAPGGRR